MTAQRPRSSVDSSLSYADSRRNPLSPSDILALLVEDRIQFAMSIRESVAEETPHLSDEEQLLLNERLREQHSNPNAGDSW